MRRLPALIVTLVVLHYQLSVEVVGVCTDDGKLPSIAHKLKDDILCNYDPTVRPVTDPSIQTIVQIGIDVSQVDMDEHSGHLTAHSWFVMSWTDQLLRWDPTEYHNLSHIRLMSPSIWVPDVRINTNHVFGYSDVNEGYHPVVVESDGQVSIGAKMQVSGICQMDVARWPFDRHVCTAVLGSSLYYGHELDYELTNEDLGNETTMPTHAWIVVSSSSKKEYRNNTYSNETQYYYPELKLSFSLERSASSLISTILIPITTSVLLFLGSLWMSPLNQVRTTFMLFSGGGHLLLLHYIGEKLPPNAGKSVHLVSFMRNSLVLIFVGFTITLVDRHLLTALRSPWVMAVSNRIHNSRWTQFILLPEENIEGGDDEASLVKPTKQPVERTVLTITCDRVVFLVSLLTYIIMIIVFSV